ncbi:MAG: TetR/AcrR family transcriptional regulator [Chroococcidiopsidaceae cyanobacterium CP_BM_ER_R8_30]|nr:TetR/AcrR family transcriptional regulator [Chroococcidiopsidaceae cyanobacterium CP_BM_ER_R8_30]
MTRLLSKHSFLRRRPQQTRSRQRVDKILKAAAEVFLEVGYEAATTRLIADRANTAIGSLYQFFPDKLAIFHAIELQHMERVRALRSQLLQPKSAQLPLEQMIDYLWETFTQLYEQPTSRVIFLQYFTSKELFQHIDERFTREFMAGLANLLRWRNSALSLEHCYLLAEVCTQCGNSLLLAGLRSNGTHRQQIFTQAKALLVAYLHPHVADTFLHTKVMKPSECPHCHSQHLSKNGHRHGKQRYLCKNCHRQFPETYSSQGYPEVVKQRCLELHRQGMSFRAIEKTTGVSHNTVILWVRQSDRAGDTLLVN